MRAYADTLKKCAVLFGPSDVNRPRLRVKIYGDHAGAPRVYHSGAQTIHLANLASWHRAEEAEGRSTVTRYTKTLEESVPAVVHEYGHYLLDVKWRADFPEWRIFSQAMQQVSRFTERYISLEYSAQLAQWELRAAQQTNDWKTASLASDRFARLTDALNALDSDDPEEFEGFDLNRAARIFEPYGELFADTVAVMFYRDGRIITKLLNFAPWQASADRDFTARNRPAPASRRDVDPHSLLDPARSALWEVALRNYVARPDADPRAILARLARVLADEAKERLDDAEYHNISPAQINSRLIKKIRRAFTD